jgi:hypothetical protein
MTDCIILAGTTSLIWRLPQVSRLDYPLTRD